MHGMWKCVTTMCGLSAALLLAADSAQAQGKPAPAAQAATAAPSMFSPGYMDLGPTIGIGGISEAGLAFGGRFERAIMRLPELGNGVLGVQASIDYWRFSDLQGIMHVNTTAIGVAATYHFAVTGKPKLDPFLGVGIGNMGASATYDDGSTTIKGSYPSGMYFLGRAGLRYFYSDHVALYGEVGAGASTINAGVTFGLGGRE